MKKDYIFTSESVTEGHPDKVCDYIADSILDEILKIDSESRVACEVCVSTDRVIILGEITSNATVDYEKIVRDAITEIGYTVPGIGFSANDADVYIYLEKQSPDIAQGVDKSFEKQNANCDAVDYDTMGAGDQGMVFGYATNENEALMPSSLYFSHKLTKKLASARKNGEIEYLLPDGKAQVTVKYENDIPVSIDTVVVSTQHKDTVTTEQLRADIKEKIILATLPKDMITDKTKFYINPTGRFVVGGPCGDTGVTGRKLIVDSYGGACPHGGGAYSGKDPSKVDRSASYMARYVAKNLVASGVCDRARVDIAYAIGVASPVSVEVECFGTAKIAENRINEIVAEVFDLRPGAIIDVLDLKKPIYRKTTNYGHFGREGFSWEATDKAEAIKKLANI